MIIIYYDYFLSLVFNFNFMWQRLLTAFVCFALALQFMIFWPLSGNNLPNDLNNITYVSRFNHRLKSCLISQAFN